MILQIGSLPGSQYEALLAPDDGKVVTTFDLLDLQCPKANVRDAGPLDIWRTRYCAVHNRATLNRMARDAARRTPLATYNFVPEPKDVEPQAPEPPSP